MGKVIQVDFRGGRVIAQLPSETCEVHPRVGDTYYQNSRVWPHYGQHFRRVVGSFTLPRIMGGKRIVLLNRLEVWWKLDFITEKRLMEAWKRYVPNAPRRSADRQFAVLGGRSHFRSF